MNDSGRLRKEDENACEKFWEIYLKEAQRYDEGLIKSWKEDMDVTLVFSGLYSAVLTAFVIQSYQELQQDQNELSAKYLQHISQQLSGATNATALPSSDQYSPAVSVVICNVLWFLSLTLALTCAFLATFVQQWARHFLHRTTILRSSITRARLLQFLYFGLKEMRMHIVVDVIPSLLHVSLIFFLAGLVAFLITVNSILSWLILSVLCAITAMYTTFTILPLIKLNSPFQTPLSQFVWRLRKHYVAYLRQLKESKLIHGTTPAVPHGSNYSPMGHSTTDPEAGLLPMTALQPTSPTKTMNSLAGANAGEGLMDAVIMASQIGNQAYESASATWILKSLNDDTELLPFVEALCDVLYGPNGIRSTNLHLVHPLLNLPDFQTRIIARTHSLMVNCSQTSFSETHKKRCLVACPKLLWILAIVTIPKELPRSQLKDAEDWRRLYFPVSPEILKTLTRMSLNPSCSPHVYSAFSLCTLQVYWTCRTLLSGASSLRNTELREIWMLIKDCPLVSVDLDLRDTDLDKDELLKNVEQRISNIFCRFLSHCCRGFPQEFKYVVSMFQSYQIVLPDASVADVFRRLDRCLQDATSRGMDANPAESGLRVRQLDSIFKVAFENSRLKPGWSCSLADPSRYLTHRISTYGWLATESIWNHPSQWDAEFLARLELLRQRPSLELGMIDVLQELLFYLASGLDQYELHVDFWFATLSDLNKHSPAQYRLAFCIRILATVKVAMQPSRSSDLDRIVENARRYLASDEGITGLIPDRARESLGNIPFLLFLQLFNYPNSFVSQHDFRTALVYYCALELTHYTPVLEGPKIMAPALGEFAKHTKRLTEQWLESHMSSTLDILQLIFMTWSSLLLRMSPVIEDTIMVSNLLPLATAIEDLYSLESRRAIEETQNSDEWKLRTRKLHLFGVHVMDLCLEIKLCRTDLKFTLPYVTPLPDSSEDEVI